MLYIHPPLPSHVFIFLFTFFFFKEKRRKDDPTDGITAWAYIGWVNYWNVWLWLAWGSFWSWDPKETLTLALFVAVSKHGYHVERHPTLTKWTVLLCACYFDILKLVHNIWVTLVSTDKPPPNKARFPKRRSFSVFTIILEHGEEYLGLLFTK
jgi:hypothetical protein